MTHVFIVNDNTFKYHLEYMFAGTGAQKDALFLQNADYINEDELTSASEKNLVGMIADISKIRSGDKVVFYLQANRFHEGLFFGVFEATGHPFYDSSDENYLKDELQKTLNFRVCIKPDAVYSKGVTEHEYLDDLSDKIYPYQLCWSLIYRKLKGNRGCTMITDFEFEDLVKKLKEKNKNEILSSTGYTYNFDKCIISESPIVNKYEGVKSCLSIKERLVYKKTKAFETHLQAYIMQNYDSDYFKSLLFNNRNVDWIGNEVSCGFGMQRIDILTISKEESKTVIRIIELKDEPAYKEILQDQLSWYIEWAILYITPTIDEKKRIEILPTIIFRKSLRKSKKYSDFLETLKICDYASKSKENVVVCNPDCFEYMIDEQNIEIKFNKIN